MNTIERANGAQLSDLVRRLAGTATVGAARRDGSMTFTFYCSLQGLAR